MKKLIAVALILASVFALCACGEAAPAAAPVTAAAEPVSTPEPTPAPPSEAELKQQAEQEAFDAAVALLEEEKYDEALEAFNNIDSYKKVADKVQETLTKKEEAERLAAEAANAARPRVTVELNKDNWKEYFEIVQIPVRNNFEELEYIAYVFRPKSEIKDKIDYDSDFSIDVKHTDTYTGEYNFTFDATKNKFTIGKAKYKSKSDLSNVTTISNEEFKWFVNTDYESCCYTDQPLWTLYGTGVFDSGKSKIIQVYKVKVSDIKGTLVLFDE